MENRYSFTLPLNAEVKGRQLSIDLPLTHNPEAFDALRKRLAELNVHPDVIAITMQSFERSSIATALALAFNA